MTDEQMTGEHTGEGSWHEVGQQFQALGEGLAKAIRTAWEREENRQLLESMKAGLESMVHDVGQAIQEASASPEGQMMRSEVERAAQSARAAGEKALQDARPYLLSALGQVNAELEKVIRRMEQNE
jgi:flagellar hook-basal body complex protein FliE